MNEDPYFNYLRIAGIFFYNSYIFTILFTIYLPIYLIMELCYLPRIEDDYLHIE
jgi:hypothetical protein